MTLCHRRNIHLSVLLHLVMQSFSISVLSPPRELDARSIKLVSPIYSVPKERAYYIFISSYTITSDKPVFESSPDFFESLFVTEMQSIPRSPDRWDFHHSVFHFLEIYLLSYRPNKLPPFPFSNDFSFHSFSPTFIGFTQFWEAFLYHWHHCIIISTRYNYSFSHWKCG